MEIFIADSYETMSKQAVDDLTQLLQPLKSPLISPASGDSPAGLYKELAKRANDNELNVSSWNFVALDEWVGMNGSDEGSCRYHLNNQLFYPLKIANDKICFFDGRAGDLQAECEQAENFMQLHGGIDAAIIGLGQNGHAGMNEPGTDRSLRSHVGALAEMTIQVGQKYFSEKRPLADGITLGIANLLEARHIFLLVSGRHKAGIVKKLLEDEISEQLPATLLRNHPGLRIYLDKESAEVIQHN